MDHAELPAIDEPDHGSPVPQSRQPRYHDRSSTSPGQFEYQFSTGSSPLHHFQVPNYERSRISDSPISPREEVDPTSNLQVPSPSYQAQVSPKSKSSPQAAWEIKRELLTPEFREPGLKLPPIPVEHFFKIPKYATSANDQSFRNGSISEETARLKLEPEDLSSLPPISSQSLMARSAEQGQNPELPSPSTNISTMLTPDTQPADLGIFSRRFSLDSSLYPPSSTAYLPSISSITYTVSSTRTQLSPEAYGRRSSVACDPIDRGNIYKSANINNLLNSTDDRKSASENMSSSNSGSNNGVKVKISSPSLSLSRAGPAPGRITKNTRNSITSIQNLIHSNNESPYSH